MSFRIQSSAITSVLIGAAWHRVTPGSFTIDAFDYVNDASARSHTGDVGFRFTSAEGLGSICGPLSSLLAVAVRP